MISNPSGVFCRYNGFTFPVTTEVQEVSGKCQYDSAQRTVECIVYSIRIRSIITEPTGTPGETTDDSLTSIRQSLTKAGGQLLFSEFGLGNFEINTNQGDVRWGPRPQMLSMKPIAGSKAVEMVWQCDVAISECSSAPNDRPGAKRPPMSFCFSLDWSIDQSGYSKRTYKGHVAVAVTRTKVTDRTIPDHADRLRDMVNVALPFGFRRESQQWTLSEDKSRLDFTITDVQMPANVPPAGVVLAEAEHTIRSPKMPHVQWTGTIRASYEVALPKSRAEAAGHFAALVADRMSTALGDIKALPPEVVAAQGVLGDNAANWLAKTAARLVLTAYKAQIRTTIIPLELMISEPEIYGRRSAALSLTYTMTLNSESMATAAAMAGLWRPVPGSDWSVWAKSLAAANVWGARGLANLGFNPADDSIVDLCVQTNIKAPPPPPPTLQEILARQQREEDLFAAILNAIRGAQLKVKGANDSVPPDESWLSYRLGVEIAQTDGTVEVQLLPETPIDYKQNAQAGLNDVNGGWTVPYQKYSSKLIQYRTAPTVAVILYGTAARVGYGISSPQLLSVGGVTPVPQNREGFEFFRQEVVGSLAGPICVAGWRLRWILPDFPTVRIGAPPNPMAGGVGKAQQAPLDKGVTLR
jgi:hypothetical protein